MVIFIQPRSAMSGFGLDLERVCKFLAVSVVAACRDAVHKLYKHAVSRISWITLIMIDLPAPPYVVFRAQEVPEVPELLNAGIRLDPI